MVQFFWPTLYYCLSYDITGVYEEWFDDSVYQMIIAVSQLIGNNVIICDSRFTESLSIISSYASNDKAVQVPRQQCLLTVSTHDYLYYSVAWWCSG